MHAIAHVLYTCNVMSAYIACVLLTGILQISRVTHMQMSSLNCAIAQMLLITLYC